MSLATRCSACGTVFRVVQDQLKVSEGWVRCGRCSEVFNAVDSLFDLEQEAPPPWPAAGNEAAGEAAPPGPAGPAPLPSHGRAPSAPQAPLPAPLPTTFPARSQAPLRASVQVPVQAASHAPPAPRAQPDPEPPDPPAPLRRAAPGQGLVEDAMAVADDSAPAGAPPGRLAAGVAVADAALPATPALADRREPVFDGPAAGVDGPARAAPPRFLVEAERAQRWQSPGVRAGLALLAVLLAVLALLQAALAWRDALAARWPVLRPGLDALCVVAACRVEPWRRLAGLSVDGSGLARIDAGTAYRLTLLLRNRDTVPLHLPAFDLTLTDAQGSVVARRVLLAAEFGVTRADIPAASEMPLQAVIDPGNRRVVGYTVDIFYP